MKLYKLTDENDKTHGGCQWGLNVEHTASGTGALCTFGWLHAYTDPLLAVLLNPIHANFQRPHLWEAEGDVGKTEHDLKVGCTRLRTIRRIPLPAITAEQQVRFAILCGQTVYKNKEWNRWAEDWLTGRDCEAAGATRAAARAAEAAEAAAREAWLSWAETSCCSCRTWAAAAARAAARAAAAAGEARASSAARAAAEAAEAATEASEGTIDLAKIAQQAVKSA